MLNIPPAADAAAGKGTDAADIEGAANALAEAGKADAEEAPKEKADEEIENSGYFCKCISIFPT